MASRPDRPCMEPGCLEPRHVGAVVHPRCLVHHRAYHSAKAREARARDPEPQRAAVRLWRGRNRDKHRASSVAYYGANRDARLAYAAARRDRLRATDPERVRAERQHQYRQERMGDRDRLDGLNRERSARWRAAHPEQARRVAAENTARRRADSISQRCEHNECTYRGALTLSWKHNEHECYMCHTPLRLGVRKGEPGHVHFDHVIPLSRGGAHCSDNIRPACQRCNQRKGNRLLEGSE